MYGYEAATGLGGLAAQAPGGDVYLPGAMRIRSPGAMLAGDMTSGVDALPYSLGNTPLGGIPRVSWTGGAVEHPAGRQLGHWREILDWHNSPAPWVLLLLLLVYGYVHLSYRRGRGAVRVGL